MDFKNAYDYLLNFSQVSENSKKESRQTINQENLPLQQNQQQSKNNNSVTKIPENLYDSIQDMKINLGDNPFDLATSFNYQKLQQTKHIKQTLLESNNYKTMSGDDIYEIKITINGPIKEDILSFLQLLGQVEVKKLNQVQQ